jgi:hypothetical protein
MTIVPLYAPALVYAGDSMGSMVACRKIEDNIFLQFYAWGIIFRTAILCEMKVFSLSPDYTVYFSLMDLTTIAFKF